MIVADDASTALDDIVDGIWKKLTEYHRKIFENMFANN